jgi:hypothetical protein
MSENSSTPPAPGHRRSKSKNINEARQKIQELLNQANNTNTTSTTTNNSENSPPNKPIYLSLKPPAATPVTSKPKIKPLSQEDLLIEIVPPPPDEDNNTNADHMNYSTPNNVFSPTTMTNHLINSPVNLPPMSPSPMSPIGSSPASTRRLKESMKNQELNANKLSPNSHSNHNNQASGAEEEIPIPPPPQQSNAINSTNVEEDIVPAPPEDLPEGKLTNKQSTVHGRIFTASTARLLTMFQLHVSLNPLSEADSQVELRKSNFGAGFAVTRAIAAMRKQSAGWARSPKHLDDMKAALDDFKFQGLEEGQDEAEEIIQLITPGGLQLHYIRLSFSRVRTQTWQY